MGNEMGINMGNIFLGLIQETFLRINIFLSFLSQNKYAVACRGGLRRKILVKNDLLKFRKCILANNYIFLIEND